MADPASAERISGEEFLAWEEKELEKHEFVRGEIFALVGGTRQHATVAGNVFSFFVQHLRGTRCRPYMTDMKLRSQAGDAFFYPDILVTCSESDHQAEWYMSEPRLIAEVLSESTEAYDRGEKFAQYRLFASLAEYVLISPVKRKVEIFRRDATGHWVLYEYGGDEPVQFASLELTIESAFLYENV
jgi:Uma2 family endonuclease